MGTTTADEITRLIQAVDRCDPNAADDLFEAVYADLRALAAARLRRLGPDQTFQATELVHEAYMRLLHRPALSVAEPACDAGPSAADEPQSGRGADGSEHDASDPLQRGPSQHLPVYEGRRHYFFAAARAIHDITVERLRRRVRGRQVRGECARQRSFITIANDDGEPAKVLELSAALERLRTISPERADLVMLRYFAGLSCAQVAEMLDMSVATVNRRWRFAKAWLAAELVDART